VTNPSPDPLGRVPGCCPALPKTARVTVRALPRLPDSNGPFRLAERREPLDQHAEVRARARDGVVIYPLPLKILPHVGLQGPPWMSSHPGVEEGVVDLVVIAVNKVLPCGVELSAVAPRPVDDLHLVERPFATAVPAVLQEADRLDVGVGRAVAEDREPEAVLERILCRHPRPLDGRPILVALLPDRIQEREGLESLPALPATLSPVSDDLVVGAGADGHVAVQEEHVREGLDPAQLEPAPGLSEERVPVEREDHVLRA
jgi:hypothetical protein